jgi:hypothetical protein
VKRGNWLKPQGKKEKIKEKRNTMKEVDMKIPIRQLVIYSSQGWHGKMRKTVINMRQLRAKGLGK